MHRDFPSHVDVAIVGSGPTGAAYARILSELRPELSVAMFEVGPLLTDPPGGHVKNIADDAARVKAQRLSEGPDTANRRPEDRRLRRAGTFLLDDGYAHDGEDGIPSIAMSSNVGGMGAHWTAACPRPGGSERIDFVDDLDGLLAEADRLLGVSTDAFDDAPFAAVVRKRLAQTFDERRGPSRGVQPMPLAVRTDAEGRVFWSGSDVVFGDVTRANPNFALWPDALVTRILVDGSRTQGLVARDMRDGSTHEVGAREVVVAADSLRTPQLLWASNIRPDALGRYLNDQPQVVFAARLDGAARAATDTGDGVAGGIVRHSGVSWVPFTDEEPFHGQVMQLDASPVKLADEDEVIPGSIVGLGWFCAKELQASDRVEFDENRTDAYGMPAMRIHYTLTDRDREFIARAGDLVRQAAAAVGQALDDEPIVLPSGASLHYQGTVRMGETDDGTSVCDQRSRVWGIAGLRVAGNGVIPTSTACNPTLTSVALAVAGARDIAANLAAHEGDQA